jgi:H+-transporting ATPase
MLILITLLNDFSLIAIGYDYVIPQQTPCVWNKQALFFISSILALVALVSSLILLEFCLNSWNTSGFFHNIGLGGLGMGQVTTSLYLKVSISDFLTLFSARTGGDWFWSQRPAPMLLGAACFALAISTILALSWPASDPDGVRALGLGYRPPAALAVFIWFYCIFWWFIQDAAKVFAHRAMHRFNWFGVNDSGVMRLPVSALEYKRAVLAGQITFKTEKSH